MFLYYGKTFESSRAGGCVVGVVCDHCGCTYYYELARIGTGAHTASYGIGSSSASQKAQDQSESDLQRRLAMEAELVPCPRCHWISDDLVKGYRLGRYRGVGKLAFEGCSGRDESTSVLIPSRSPRCRKLQESPRVLWKI